MDLTHKNYLDNRSGIDIETHRWDELALSTLKRLGVEGESELYISYVGVDEMATLNQELMGKEGPTDVLSFDVSFEVEISPEIPRILGEVYICPQVAASNAPEHVDSLHRGTTNDELALLLVHGILHISGMDHMVDEEAEEMEELERVILRAAYYGLGD